MISRGNPNRYTQFWRIAFLFSKEDWVLTGIATIKFDQASVRVRMAVLPRLVVPPFSGTIWSIMRASFQLWNVTLRRFYCKYFLVFRNDILFTTSFYESSLSSLLLSFPSNHLIFSLRMLYDLGFSV